VDLKRPWPSAGSKLEKENSAKSQGFLEEALNAKKNMSKKCIPTYLR